MRFMRLIVADRSSGGVLAALLAVMVLAQLLFAGVAAGAGAMPTTSADICTASDAGHPADGGDHRDHRPDCPCGLLCQAGAQLAAAVDGPVGAVRPIRFAVAVERPHVSPPLPARCNVGLHRESQGPPATVFDA